MTVIERMADANRIASELSEDPRRAADVERYHKVLIDALNATHDGNGEQDSLAVLDGLAHTLAQLVGGLDDPDMRRGYIEFVVRRAEWLVDLYRADGSTAQWRRRA